MKLFVVVLLVGAFIGGIYVHSNFESKCQSVSDATKIFVTELIEK